MEAVHVYPIDDLFLHILLGTSCPCKPKIEQRFEEVDYILITHNSYDMRELGEAEQPSA